MAPSTNPYGRVRVKLPSGAETTVSRAYAKRHGLTVLQKNAEDTFGRVIRTEPGTGEPAPTISTSMTRAQLEEAAGSAGVSPEAIAAARNKGDLVDVIQSTNGDADAGGADEAEEAGA